MLRWTARARGSSSSPRPGDPRRPGAASASPAPSPRARGLEKLGLGLRGVPPEELGHRRRNGARRERLAQTWEPRSSPRESSPQPSFSWQRPATSAPIEDCELMDTAARCFFCFGLCLGALPCWQTFSSTREPRCALTGAPRRDARGRSSVPVPSTWGGSMPARPDGRPRHPWQTCVYPCGAGATPSSRRMSALAVMGHGVLPGDNPRAGPARSRSSGTLDQAATDEGDGGRWRCDGAPRSKLEAGAELPVHPPGAGLPVLDLRPPMVGRRSPGSRRRCGSEDPRPSVHRQATPARNPTKALSAHRQLAPSSKKLPAIASTGRGLNRGARAWRPSHDGVCAICGTATTAGEAANARRLCWIRKRCRWHAPIPERRRGLAGAHAPGVAHAAAHDLGK